MLPYYKQIFKWYIFWMLFFAGNRLIFLLYQNKLPASVGWPETASVFYHAWTLDTSAACYIISVSFIVMVLRLFVRSPVFNAVHKITALIFLIVYSLISCAELGLYDVWKTKIHYEALTHLRHPSEIINTTPAVLLLSLSALATLSVITAFLLYKKLILIKEFPVKKNLVAKIIFIPVASGILFAGIRGGVNTIPIGQGEAYFSHHQVLNDAAVNTGWNLLHSYIQFRKASGKNPYLYYDIDEAKETVRNLYRAEKDTTIAILKTKRPDIVLIILESWSADLIAPMGGLDSLTPNFNTLAKHGILFTNIYAPGNLSHEGILSLLSGYPAQPLTSIIKQPDKYSKFPSLVPLLKQAGYSCSFIYGGQLIYANIRSYIIYNQFDRLTEQRDFPFGTPSNRLTVDDEYLFTRAMDEINQLKEPFFTVIYTGSSHAPYDVPMKQKFNIGKNWDETGYINAAYYTDSCLGVFFKAASKQPWYRNTLFFLISDHGHPSPKGYGYYTKEFRKIPALLYGEVINDDLHGTTIEHIASQMDFTATLAAQLGMDGHRFHWSKNLFNPTIPEFAYFSFFDGIGWVRPWGNFVYDNLSNSCQQIEVNDSALQEKLLKEGKSYIETVFQEYLDFK